MVKKCKGWLNIFKQIDAMRLLTDIFRYLVGCYFFTVSICICNQNGWFPFFEKRIVSTDAFENILFSLFCVIPIIMFLRALRGRYTIIAIMDIKLKLTGRAKQSVLNVKDN